MMMKNTNKRASIKRFHSALPQQDERKEYSYSRLISFFRFSDWVAKYSMKGSALSPPKRDKETFIDVGGTKRYVDNWQPVEDKLSNALSWEDFFLKTGCIKMSQLYEIYESTKEELEEKEESINGSKREKGDSHHDRDRDVPSHLKEYCYINEWQRLWIYLENDEKDELAEYAPLFRLLIEFLFHPRMQQVMTGLTVYNILINVIILAILPTWINAGFSVLYIFFTTIMQLIAYYAMVILYRGKISLSATPTKVPAVEGKETPSPSSPVEDDKQIEAELSVLSQSRVDILAYSLSTNANNHFSFIRKELCSRVKQELYLVCCMFTSSSSSSSSSSTSKSTEPATICCGCEESDQMMKWRQYQQKRSEMIRRHQQKKQLSYHELLNISLKFLIRVNGVNPNHINFNRWSSRIVLLFIIVGFPLYVFIVIFLLEDLAVLNQDCSGTFKIDAGNCESFTYIFALTIGQLTLFIPHVLFGASIMVALVSLAYGAEIVYRLVDSFLLKFRSLRRIEEYNIEDFLIAEPSSQSSLELKEVSSSTTRSILHPDPEEFTNQEIQEGSSSLPRDLEKHEQEDGLSHHPLYSWVKRDAIEHYFFICEVFSASDKIWSNALTGIFFVALVVVAYYVSFVTLAGEIVTASVVIEVVIFVAVRFLLLFIYPIASLCHANASVTELTAFFNKSSKDDFQLIGGCQEWVEFTTSCPAAWTFMGLWITWDRLFGVLWTFLAGGIASAVAAFFSSF